MRNPPGPRPPRSHLPLQLPGLAEAPALQLQHPVGADAVEGSASCGGVPARLHSASPQALAGEPRTDCSEAVAGARVATTPCAPPGACRLRSGREVREGAWPGWSQGAIVEVQREGGVEREDRCAGGAARAGAPEVAPSARDNLRSGGGVKTQPGNAASPGSRERGAWARERPFGERWRRSLPAAPKQGGKGGVDEPYRSLTLGTAFPLMDNGEGKVKESCFIFFPHQPQNTKKTWSDTRQSQTPAFILPSRIWWKCRIPAGIRQNSPPPAPDHRSPFRQGSKGSIPGFDSPTSTWSLLV